MFLLGLIGSACTSIFSTSVTLEQLLSSIVVSHLATGSSSLVIDIFLCHSISSQLITNISLLTFLLCVHSSLTAAVTCIIGLQYGHILARIEVMPCSWVKQISIFTLEKYLAALLCWHNINKNLDKDVLNSMLSYEKFNELYIILPVIFKASCKLLLLR